jgi:hypothetical protein
MRPQSFRVVDHRCFVCKKSAPWTTTTARPPSIRPTAAGVAVLHTHRIRSAARVAGSDLENRPASTRSSSPGWGDLAGAAGPLPGGYLSEAERQVRGGSLVPRFPTRAGSQVKSGRPAAGPAPAAGTRFFVAWGGRSGRGVTPPVRPTRRPATPPAPIEGRRTGEGDHGELAQDQVRPPSR